MDSLPTEPTTLETVIPPPLPARKPGVTRPTTLNISNKETKVPPKKTTIYRYVIHGSFFGDNFNCLHESTWFTSVEEVVTEGNKWIDTQRFDWMSDFVNLVVVLRIESKEILMDSGA